jgi:hypothetical protein
MDGRAVVSIRIIRLSEQNQCAHCEMAVNYPACSTLPHSPDGYPALDLFFGEGQEKSAEKANHA